MGEAASLTAGPKFVKDSKSGHFLAHRGQRLVFRFVHACTIGVGIDSFTGSSVPLIESLKSKAHLINDYGNRNLIRLQ